MTIECGNEGEGESEDELNRTDDSLTEHAALFVYERTKIPEDC